MTDNNDSIYVLNNKYGYKINVNHPKIRPLYDVYKKKIGAMILSDKERFQFESIIFKMIQRSKNNVQ